jgi:predicted HTH transcriptional regulator
VTFSSHPSLVSKEPILPKEQQLVIDWEILNVVTNAGSIEQKQQVKLAMEYVQQYSAITNRDYREIAGTTDTTALRDLEILLERGVLKPIGKDRSRKYTLP